MKLAAELGGWAWGDIVAELFELAVEPELTAPTFVTDFPKTARCLFDGVLGSELLPLCAWQVDLEDGVLRCESDLARLPLADAPPPTAARRSRAWCAGSRGCAWQTPR